MAEAVAVDAHVHLHEPDKDMTALCAAAVNFARFAPVPSRTGVLMLADTAGNDAFSRLQGMARSGSGTGLRLTDEDISLWAEVGEWRLLIVAGRQWVTAERLEVLALGARTDWNDHPPLSRALARIAAADGLAVLPWGCGKWLGERGRLVRQAVAQAPGRSLFLGDNGGRPWWWDVPQFRRAGEAHMAMLPGTDPLPIAGDYARIGSFGCIVPVRPSSGAPAADLKAALRDPQVRLSPFGSPERSGRFVLNQLRLRFAA